LTTSYVASLAEQGRTRWSRKLGSLLERDTAEIEALAPTKWALLNQATAALTSEDVWRQHHAPDIEQWIGGPFAWASDPGPAPFDVYRHTDCVSFTLPNYEEPGYFAGFAKANIPPHWSAAPALLRPLRDWEWLRRFVGCVVVTGPFATPHLSSSQRNMPGTIFSLDASSSAHAAEVLVHEGGHTTFNLALEGLGVIHDLLTSPRSYYSPWKGTNRPAFGLLHAMFAFGRVELFRRSVLKTRTSFESIESIAKIRAALPTIELCCAAVGSDGLKRVFDDLYEELGVGE
jgi:hypothetical protein